MVGLQYNKIELLGEGNATIDLIETDAFDAFVLYEDMTAPCLSARIIFKDLNGMFDDIIKLGKTIIRVDISHTELDYPTIPDLYGYEFTSIPSTEHPSLKMWEISCVSLDYIQQQSSIQHLNMSEKDIWETDEWILPVDEYVEKLHYLHSTGALGSSQQNYALHSDPTFNSCWYRPRVERGAESLRRDEEKTIGELIEQATENACDKTNKNAVNFFYWQGLKNWNFKSVENISKEEPVNTYASITSDSYDPEIDNTLGRILIPPTVSSLNELELLDSGALFSTMVYSIPRIRKERKKDWYTSDIGTYYYRINCSMRTNFPAAIVGFNPIETEEEEEGNPYRWQYAFVEVYMEWDIEEKRAIFKIKPIDQFPIRSSIEFSEREDEEEKEKSINDTGDYFTEPAYNLIEVGNDGLYDPETREGWEAPGFRVDTQLWEESCMKLQPIRGSEPKSAGEFVNSTDVLTIADSEMIQDYSDCSGKFPIVDMKIYWDKPEDDSEELSKPHYFFSVANTTDGECDEDEELLNDGDCLRP